MSDFLKNLKESLEKGEPDKEYQERMNKILKKADSIENPSGSIDKRIKEVGEVSGISEEEAKKANEEYEDFINSEEEKNDRYRMIGEIETLKNELSALKDEYEENVKTYNSSIEKLTNEFENKYKIKYGDISKEGSDTE